MSSKIKFSSRGIEKVAAEISKKFPDSRLTTVFKTEKRKQIDLNADILIATEFALKRIDFTRVGLIGFINFDQLTAGADFRAKERAMQLTMGLVVFNKKAKFVAQTYNRNNLILKAVFENNLNLFYQEELEVRQALAYSPYKKLIKIISQDKSAAKSFYLLERQAKKLKQIFKGFEILGPVPAYPRRVRSVFKYHLIIKVNVNDDLKNLIAAVDADFVIDVDPEKLS